MQAMVKIGERLKAIRTCRYLTQRGFPERAGTSPATIVKLEHDEVEPRPTTIFKLAEALEVHPDDLTGFVAED